MVADTRFRPDLAATIAGRVAEEQRARAKLIAFAEHLFGAAERLADELTADGVPVDCRRSRGGVNLRLEMRATGIPERIVLLTQRSIAHVPDHPGPHGALYVFVVTEGSAAGVAVERFLVSAADDVHCDGVCAKGERSEPGAAMRRLIEAIWAKGRQVWTPFASVGTVSSAALEAPHLHGQLGFRPHTARSGRYDDAGQSDTDRLMR